MGAFALGDASATNTFLPAEGTRLWISLTRVDGVEA